MQQYDFEQLLLRATPGPRAAPRTVAPWAEVREAEGGVGRIETSVLYVQFRASAKPVRELTDTCARRERAAPEGVRSEPLLGCSGASLAQRSRLCRRTEPT